MKKLAIGVQHFPKLIREQYQYIDKTPLLWRMIQEGNGYFLARPRRFGKSLLTSTLATLFRGERDYFDGLWINGKEYAWTQFPLIHLDFSEVYGHSPDMIQRSLNQRLVEIALGYQLCFSSSSYPAETFNQLIKLLDQGDGVVVLIDEYDQPLVSHLYDESLLQANREILKDFFSVIKSQEAHIRFAFVTGVSKFAQVSLFSGMNNLTDISLHPAYVTLTGITEQEIDLNYGQYLTLTAQQRNQSIEQVRTLIRTWYNGYRFGRSAMAQKVYNPVSLHSFLTTHELSNYWFSTATPTFAIELINKQNYPIPNFDRGATIGIELEKDHDGKQLNVLALLFQTGYLTITNFDEETLTYQLSIPNEEVRLSFYDHLLKEFVALDASSLKLLAEEMKLSLIAHDLESFFVLFNQLLAEIPYPIQIHKEAYYHSLIFLVLRTLNLNVEAEVVTSRGRLDLLLRHQKNLYIFEFKIDSTAESALQQIEARGYAARYQNSANHITLVGVNIDRKQRAVSDWKCKELQLPLPF